METIQPFASRKEQARQLRMEGLTIRTIAQKMNVPQNSVLWYIYGKPEHARNWRLHKLGKHIRIMIREELQHFQLPVEWEDELARMFAVYYTGHSGYSRNLRGDIQSLIQLLCRRNCVPTPRKLQILTFQGKGSTRASSGYMDALNTLGGVQPANPLNYIRFFVTQERLPEDEIKKAKKLLQKIPKKHWRFRNPRGVAGAIIYELHRKGVNPQRNVYSQENIGRLLVVSAVTVRNTWRILFRMKEAC